MNELTILFQVAVLLPISYVGVLYLLEEDGPFDIFHRIRKLAGFVEEGFSDFDESGQTIMVTEWVAGDGFWSRVLNCHRCLSPYVSFLVVLFSLIAGLSDLNIALFLWLGLTGATVYLFERGD